jgi:ribosomal protein S1
MKRTKIGLLMIGTIAAIGLATPAFAADEPSTGRQQEKAEKEQSFEGKVEAVDTTAKTLTVDGKLIYVVDRTKLTKDSKAIMLSNIMVGEKVHGTTRQTFDGKSEAITLKVGEKAKEGEKGKDTEKKY